MAKKKRPKKIRDVSKTDPKAKIAPEEFAMALGAEIVTDPEEIRKLRNKLPQRP